MTAALTPTLALAYLRELTVGLRSAAVIGADGSPAAGDSALAARAAAVEAPPGGVQRTPIEDGTLLVARSSTGAAIAVVAGDSAVLELLELDLRRVAESLTTSDSQP